MSTKLDPFLGEMLNVEIDVMAAWDKYGKGFHQVTERFLPTDPKLGALRDIINERDTMLMVHAMVLGLRDTLVNSIKKEVPSSTRVRLKDLKLTELLKEARDDEEAVLQGGVDFLVEELREVDQLNQDEFITPYEELEQANEREADARGMEKIRRWTRSEAETLVGHVLLFAAETIYQYAKTSRTGLPEALNEQFQSDDQDERDVDLSGYLYSNIIGFGH